ncbi:hypothetical protein [Huintestinicola sp.]|uniref:hypothetical protein n=1 Tax=Huintestinicola sp. TaxID=2981661 RepID=UPI003D7EE907
MNGKFKTVSAPGFLTLITVFLIITLASVGAAALSATGRGDRLTEKSAERLEKYQAAKNLSAQRLSEIDGCIAAAADSGLFDMNFEALIEELTFASCTKEGEHYIVSCSTPIDEKSSVYLELSVDAFPTDRRGSYEIIREAVVYAAEEEDEEERLNVWQGF